MPEQAVLSLIKIDAGYGKLTVLRGVSLDVCKGEIVDLVGPNGAGKSTLLKTISGSLLPSAGAVRFRDTDLMGMPPHAIAGLGIAHVQEGRKVFSSMSVRENLYMGAYLKSKRTLIPDSLDFVFGLFPRLKERESQDAGTLSGGEQQMLAIARALMMRPALLLLDEPSLGLAPLLISSIYESLVALNREGLTILLVEQNVRKALSVSHRAYVIEDGEIALKGTSDEVGRDSRVVRAYLGI